MSIKLYGYIASGIGLIGLLISTEKIMSKIPLISGLSPKYIVITSVILIGVGIVLVMSTSSKKSQIGKEVPIYKGKEIIGYRVIGK